MLYAGVPDIGPSAPYRPKKRKPWQVKQQAEVVPGEPPARSQFKWVDEGPQVTRTAYEMVLLLALAGMDSMVWAQVCG